MERETKAFVLGSWDIVRSFVDGESGGYLGFFRYGLTSFWEFSGLLVNYYDIFLSFFLFIYLSRYSCFDFPLLCEALFLMYVSCLMCQNL